MVALFSPTNVSGGWVSDSTSGCTDVTAVNFDSDADEDDGTCLGSLYSLSVRAHSSFALDVHSILRPAVACRASTQ
jgi:hypothetical protein